MKKSDLGSIRIFGWFFMLVGFVLALVLLPPAGQATTTADFKNAAKKYVEGAEKVGTPITLRYQDSFYYYVPFEVNNTFSGQLPGLMLDSKASPVTDSAILKELFKYPALIKKFSSNPSGFNKVATAKVPALAEYCQLLKVQKIKFDALNKSGNVAGILYEGTKLAFDAVGLVKSGVVGFAALLKDLAKGAVKDAIISYFVQADSRAVLENTQKAFDNSKTAYSACQASLNAWNTVISTTGKASPAEAVNATAKTREMFSAEATAITNLRLSLKRINNYPKLVTQIGKNDYDSTMTSMTKLVKKLETERKYWLDLYNSTNDKNLLGHWTDEQRDRVIPKVTKCGSVNLSTNYSLYKYTHSDSPCQSYQDKITTNSLSLRCSSSAAVWRGYWVKKVSISGLKKARVVADLRLTDYTKFFTECSGVGVKYDNYVSLLVLSADPNTSLKAQCNRTVSADEWAKCSILPTDTTILASCGVPKCSSSKHCDLNFDTKGKSEVYLAFHTSDAWLADLEGAISNTLVCPGS